MNTTTTTTPPKKDYLNAVLRGLEGNQTQCEQKGPKLIQFPKELKKENTLPSQNSLQQLSHEQDMLKIELRALEIQIREQENILKELKKTRAIRRSLETINGLTLQVSDFLKNRVRIDFQTMDWLLMNLTIDLDTCCFVMKDDCYINSIHLYNMILTNSIHQEDKDAACLQLALHELRVNDFQKANNFALLILDDEIKREYDWRLETQRY